MHFGLSAVHEYIILKRTQFLLKHEHILGCRAQLRVTAYVTTHHACVMRTMHASHACHDTRVVPRDVYMMSRK